MTAGILLVDDEPKLLSSLRRKLAHKFDLETAGGGEEGLDVLAKDGPFAVVVSDMRMPGLTGLDFLVQVEKTYPDTVRMMLTGNSDQQTAMDAVNQGHIFRFLTKPCSHDVLVQSLKAGLRQYALVTAERELLSSTLSASVALMSEMLSAAKPLAYGRSARIRPLVKALCEQLQVENSWQVELAAMLSQLGCMAVPDNILQAIFNGEAVPATDRKLFEEHPRRGYELIKGIPRLGGVAEIVRRHEQRFDARSSPATRMKGEEIPVGARIIKVVLDFDFLRLRHSSTAAYELLRRRAGWYDPVVLQAFSQILNRDDAGRYVVDVGIYTLDDRMTLEEHIVSERGDILVAQGQKLSPTLIERLKNYAQSAFGVKEPIRVSMAARVVGR